MSRSPIPRRTRATLIGLAAIAMWATLGVFTSATGEVPPIEKTAICFTLSGLGSMAWLGLTGRIGLLKGISPVSWAVMIGGLAGYHVFYFLALRLAPPVEANLVSYLWPLLIVLFSGLLPGERLRRHHIAGVVLGFIGVVVLVGQSAGRFSLDGRVALGFALALCCAVIWSSYSVLSRRLPHVPSEAIAAACLASGVLTGALHFALEPTVVPATPGVALAILGLAVFPVGLAFFVWDIGVKGGDIQVLGAGSYATPLASTLLLIAFGFGKVTPAVGFAALSVTLGAVIAAKDLLFAGKAVENKAAARCEGPAQ